MREFQNQGLEDDSNHQLFLLLLLSLQAEKGDNDHSWE